MTESEEYIEILKEQLEEKSRHVHALTSVIAKKDQEILMLKDLLNGNRRGQYD